MPKHKALNGERRSVRRRRGEGEEPIADVYAEIDNDLARDNLENDIPEPDQPK